MLVGEKFWSYYINNNEVDNKNNENEILNTDKLIKDAQTVIDAQPAGGKVRHIISF